MIRDIRHGSRWDAAQFAPLAGALIFVVLVSAMLMRQARAATPPTAELPNLVADPPDGASLGVDSSGGQERLLLRFNGYVHNVGPGALDFRGSRQAPAVGRKLEEEAAHAREAETELSQQDEEALASPSMSVSQRVFTTDEQQNNVERPHVEEPSGGEMVYVNADGHHHWHLQRAARYSLWNATRTAEAAPSQKVGFCLEDSEHVELAVGPVRAVYGGPSQHFCQHYNPDATSVYQGVSAGWRDIYPSGIAFQWIDVSYVLPGQYWLREDVNPNGVIKETGGANSPAYSTSPVTIPGFDALAQSVDAESGKAQVVTLEATAWSDTGTPRYAIVSPPGHGTLSAIEGDRVSYTPAPGYVGPDAFTYAAIDPNSPFPRSPAVAAISIQDTKPTNGPSVTILGAPASLAVHARVQLTAQISGASGGVRWHASAGRITAHGLYTAPAKAPASGSAIVTARLREDHSISGRVSIAITTARPSRSAISSPRRRPAPRREHSLAAPQPSALAISGAPSSMLAGTSVQLSAGAGDQVSSIEWTATAGTLTPDDARGLAVEYRAPNGLPPGSKVSIDARPRGVRGLGGRRTITVVAIPREPPAAAAPASEPAQPLAAQLAIASTQAPYETGRAPASRHRDTTSLSRPTAMLIGRELVMTVVDARPARVRLSAAFEHQQLGSCSTRLTAGESFTCRLALAPTVPTRAALAVTASASSGHSLIRNVRAPAPVEAMTMPSQTDTLARSIGLAEWQFLCTAPTRSHPSQPASSPLP